MRISIMCVCLLVGCASDSSGVDDTPIDVMAPVGSFAITGPFDQPVSRSIEIQADAGETLTVTGLPAGATFECPEPLQATNPCTLTLPAGVAYGSYTIAVTVTEGDRIGAVTLMLELRAPFTVSFGATAMTVMDHGNSVPYVVGFDRAPDFEGAVTLSFDEPGGTITATCSDPADLAGILPKPLTESCAFVLHSTGSPLDEYAATLTATGGGHTVSFDLTITPQDVLLTGADTLVVDVPGQYLTEIQRPIQMALRGGLEAQVVKIELFGLPASMTARCLNAEDNEVSPEYPMTESCTLNVTIGTDTPVGIVDPTLRLRATTDTGIVREVPLTLETHGYEVSLAGGLNEATVHTTPGFTSAVQVRLTRRVIAGSYYNNAVLIQSPPPGVSAACSPAVIAENDEYCDLLVVLDPDVTGEFDLVFRVTSTTGVDRLVPLKLHAFQPAPEITEVALVGANPAYPRQVRQGRGTVVMRVNGPSMAAASAATLSLGGTVLSGVLSNQSATQMDVTFVIPHGAVVGSYALNVTLPGGPIASPHALAITHIGASPFGDDETATPDAGSAGRPFLSIGAALAVAAAGDTVRLASGTFGANETFGTAHFNLRAFGAVEEWVLQADDDGGGLVVPSGVTIDGASGSVLVGPGRNTSDRAQCLLAAGGQTNCSAASGSADLSVGMRGESATSAIRNLEFVGFDVGVAGGALTNVIARSNGIGALNILSTAGTNRFHSNEYAGLALYRTNFVGVGVTVDRNATGVDAVSSDLSIERFVAFGNGLRRASNNTFYEWSYYNRAGLTTRGRRPTAITWPGAARPTITQNWPYEVQINNNFVITGSMDVVMNYNSQWPYSYGVLLHGEGLTRGVMRIAIPAESRALWKGYGLYVILNDCTSPLGLDLDTLQVGSSLAPFEVSGTYSGTNLGENHGYNVGLWTSSSTCPISF